jgi:hypothetical protein
MTTLSNSSTTPSRRLAGARNEVAFDTRLAVCFGLVVLATVLVVLSTFAGPTGVNIDVPPIGP